MSVTEATVDPVAEQLRRRRQASLRLPPYGDGPADPLDQLAALPIGAPQDCHGAEHTAAGWRPCCRRAA